MLNKPLLYVMEKFSQCTFIQDIVIILFKSVKMVVPSAVWRNEYLIVCALCLCICIISIYIDHLLGICLSITSVYLGRRELGVSPLDTFDWLRGLPRLLGI